MAARYYISLPDLGKARASGEFATRSQSAEGFAEDLQAALRTGDLAGRWQNTQEEPDKVDPTLLATDPSAQVTGKQDDLHADLIVTTSLPGSVLKHRLGLLAGSNWELRDVTAA